MAQTATVTDLHPAFDGVRNASNEMALVGMARNLAPADLNAVRTSIGAELRRLYSNVLREEIPGKMAELLKQLDQPTEASPRGQDTTTHNSGRRHIRRR